MDKPGPQSGQQSAAATPPTTNTLAARAIASHVMEGDAHRREEELSELLHSNTTSQDQLEDGTDKNSLGNFSILIAKQRQMAESAMEGEERRKERALTDASARTAAEAEKRARDESARLAKTAEEREREMRRITGEARERQQEALVKKNATVAELINNSSIAVRPVRTLKEDMKGAGKDLSIVSMAIKEDEHRRRKTAVATQEAKKNSMFAVVSTILIVAGIAVGAYFFYSLSFPDSTGPETVTQTYGEAMIFAEKSNIVPIGLLSDTQLIAILRNEVGNLNAPLSTVEEVLMVERVGAESRVTLARFVAILRLRTPEILVRNLESGFMYGVHSAPTNAGFLIITPQAYDRAFAGMLAWEPFLVRDLYSILSGRSPEASLESSPWSDTVIRNVNARIVRDGSGRVALLYAFFNQNTLIITTSEDTFTEILTRLTTPRPPTR
ncbi:MAG: hypothetical protein COV10_03685 [Candidatus Vogelbacteria bacterium CG10_big_fil_rev_8_21_14_0_10_51_16]|uniref:Uncharacterized protein n=1 Tax=Candidatus Vogelbacteria bacterium CG10_big_fil_rev_8_21_14_0_10_51_16 TaxID=1975045 RepID=A0A2H0RDG7_9BACT|nr:MAG: hypothetical protein COV10_03685 [Candidatus Vogelbacteria bacterium CG10_big_fil_rev_8_21_14_0_10_51_16]